MRFGCTNNDQCAPGMQCQNNDCVTTYNSRRGCTDPGAQCPPGAQCQDNGQCRFRTNR